MKASFKRMRYGITLFLTLAGMIGWLALPSLQQGQANVSPAASGVAPKPLADSLDAQRQAALNKLLAQLKAGAPFSEEETLLLRRFEAGETLTELEADVVISRALYDFYIRHLDLTRQQAALLDQYTMSVARRNTDVLDLKTQALNRRIAAAAAAPPRAPQAAPPNDLCSGAEVIPAAGPFPYNTTITNDITDATTAGDPPTPSCQSSVSRSIWYTFTPSASGNYTIATCTDAGTGTTVEDTVMAIYTSSNGCVGPFTEIPSSAGSDGCSDDDCVSGPLQSVITTRLNSGTTYYVVVWEFGTAAPPAGTTAIQLNVSVVLPPANDTCAAATALPLGLPVAGTTVAASNDYQLSGAACFTGLGQTSSPATGRDVVYSFTAPSAGDYSFKVINFFSGNLVLYAASSCPASTPGTPVTVATCIAAANRHTTRHSEEIPCLTLASGQQIFIFVDENAFFDGSSFIIEASRCTKETEPNGTPATANTPTFGIEGTIGVAGEADFFSLGTPPAGSRVFALIDGIASANGDFDLRVTTATDTLEYDDADADFLFGITAPVIAGTPTTGTQTFLRVSCFDTSGPFATLEPYRLYYNVQPPGANPLPNCPSVTTSATPETEPNDTVAQANTAGNKYFSGSLPGPAPSSDVDVYSFTASAGSVVFIGMDEDPCRDGTPVNGKLELLDTNGTSVLITVNDTNRTFSTASGAGSLTSTTPSFIGESLAYRVATSGTYYVRVSIGTALTDSTGAGDYLLSIFVNSTTAARFDNDPASAASAVRYSDGASLRWQTGYEIENLGFNVYREEAGKRTRVNPQLIAGSAMLVGPTTALGAGRSYSWFDPGATSSSQYWVEAVDLNGQSHWQGPIAVSRAPGKTADRMRSMTLNEAGRFQMPEAETARVDRAALIKTHDNAETSAQAVFAGQSAVKLAVKGEGFYRVSLADLAAAGFKPGNDLGNLQLYVDGEQVPININAKPDSSAAIEFYGIGIDSAFTTEHIYWLVAGNQPGLRMPQVAAPASASSAGSFLYSAELKPRSLYFGSLRNGDKENFFGPVIASAPVDQSLSLTHVDKGRAGNAQLEVALQGVTLISHRVEVQLNGARVGEVAFNNQSSGVARLQVAQSLLKEGNNTVRLVPLGGASDISLVDYLRVSYWHTLTADGNQLRFTATHKQAVGIDGFSSPNIRVFDVTNPNAAQEIAGTIKSSKKGYSVLLSVPNAGLRTLLAIADDGARQPANVRLDTPSSLRQTANAADLLILTRGDLLRSFAPLAELRKQQGLAVALVDVEDVYDEFGYGNKTPQAIKAFLQYAATSWQHAPRFVLIGGDASYDGKNYLGYGDADVVPSQQVETEWMEAASDDWYADFDGDGIAELAVGRLPVRTASEAAAVVAKIIAYDSAARPEGVLLVADAQDENSGASFEAASSELRGVIPTGQNVEQVNRGDLSADAARGRLLDALNRGPRVVNYYGHGNVSEWRGGLLTPTDAAQLANGGNLSFFTMMTCLNGYFNDPAQESLAESLLKAKGGAIAVWASSGMTEPGDQALAVKEMFHQLLDQSGQTVGEAALKAKAAVRGKDVRRTWILLGDPTTKLR
ncbi:MAG: C25 family cysteine peptidase [Blastocatellia bacterium]